MRTVVEEAAYSAAFCKSLPTYSASPSAAAYIRTYSIRFNTIATYLESSFIPVFHKVILYLKSYDEIHIRKNPSCCTRLARVDH